jgi:glycerate dehydrogenase
MAEQMNMVILDGYTLNPGDLSWDEIDKLGELRVYDRTPPHQTVERASKAEIVLTNKAPISADTMEKLPNLKFIAVMATGYDIVDIAAAALRGVPVSNVPEYGTDSVAQFVFALILELCHQVGSHQEAVKAGEWAAASDWCFWKSPQILLKGKKVGIVGLGRIGRRVGELAHAFGMEVMAFDPHTQESPAYAPFCWKPLKELFAEADVVSLHCPQTEENVRFVNGETLTSMKKDAFFINASRGGLVDEDGLAQALNNKRIAGAALDVVSVEPIRPDNPLLSAKNCLISPHIAWASLGARRTLMAETVRNIRAFISGDCINMVNKEYFKD